VVPSPNVNPWKDALSPAVGVSSVQRCARMRASGPDRWAAVADKNDRGRGLPRQRRQRVVLAVNAQQAELHDLRTAGVTELLHHKVADVLPSSAFSVRLRSTLIRAEQRQDDERDAVVQRAERGSHREASGCQPSTIARRPGSSGTTIGSRRRTNALTPTIARPRRILRPLRESRDGSDGRRCGALAAGDGAEGRQWLTARSRRAARFCRCWCAPRSAVVRRRPGPRSPCRCTGQSAIRAMGRR
jgi:hypothetical protein